MTMLKFRRLLPTTLVLLAGCSSHTHLGTAAAVPPPREVVRVMPLGDSITRGSGSGYGNYRRPLQSLLARDSRTFLFVGANTEQSQNYHGADPEQRYQPYQPGHEGYGGFRIEQIAADVAATDDGGVSYPGLSKTLAAGTPDVALLMLGTNDVNQKFDPGGPGYGGGAGFAADAAARLDALVSRLYLLSPKLTVVVAAITPLADPAKEKQVEAYNALVPQIVAAHKKSGQKILFADMHAPMTAADLSPDGVHPGTRGYDKMARVWYSALTGLSAPPLSPLPPAAHGPGRIGAANIFTPADTVSVSSTFAGVSLLGARLVDGTAKAFVFGIPGSERVSISGFHGPIGRLRFFDTPSYTERTPGTVTIYASPSALTSLAPAGYVKLGTYSLPVVADAYETPTQPPAHPDPSDPASRPATTIGFCDLSGLSVPAGTQSVLLDFSKSGGYGDGLSEIQAFAY